MLCGNIANLKIHSPFGFKFGRKTSNTEPLEIKKKIYTPTKNDVQSEKRQFKWAYHIRPPYCLCLPLSFSVYYWKAFVCRMNKIEISFVTGIVSCGLTHHLHLSNSNVWRQGSSQKRIYIYLNSSFCFVAETPNFQWNISRKRHRMCHIQVQSVGTKYISSSYTMRRLMCASNCCMEAERLYDLQCTCYKFNSFYDICPFSFFRWCCCCLNNVMQQSARKAHCGTSSKCR